jgi:hypothetical protein
LFLEYNLLVEDEREMEEMMQREDTLFRPDTTGKIIFSILDQFYKL